MFGLAKVTNIRKPIPGLPTWLMPSHIENSLAELIVAGPV